MEKTLVMKFVDSELKKVSYSISEVKDDITSGEVETLMDAIIANQEAFEFKNPLVSKDSATITGKTVTEIFKA